MLSSLSPDMLSCFDFWLCAADEERCLETAESRFEADRDTDAGTESEAGPDFLVIRSNGRSDMGKGARVRLGGYTALGFIGIQYTVLLIG